MMPCHRRPVLRGACAATCLVLGIAAPAATHAGEHAATRPPLAAARDSALLYLERGEAHRLRGEWNEAHADYDRAAAPGDALAEVDLCRGALLLDQALPAQADTSFERFRARAPGFPRELWVRGHARARAGYPLLGALEMQHALAHMSRPRPEEYMEWALALAAAGPEHLPRALAALDTAVARLGACILLVDQAVALEVEDGRWEAALARIERNRPIFGHWVAALVRKGEVLSLAGRDLEARAAFAEALTVLEAMPPGQRDSPAARELMQRMLDHLPALAPADARR